MEVTEMHIQIPADDAKFLQEYAAREGRSVSEIIDRYIRHLRAAPQRKLNPGLEVITGLLPPDLDVQDEYARGMLAKHR